MQMLAFLKHDIAVTNPPLYWEVRGQPKPRGQLIPACSVQRSRPIPFLYVASAFGHILWCCPATVISISQVVKQRLLRGVKAAQVCDKGCFEA